MNPEVFKKHKTNKNATFTYTPDYLEWLCVPSLLRNHTSSISLSKFSQQIGLKTAFTEQKVHEKCALSWKVRGFFGLKMEHTTPSSPFFKQMPCFFLYKLLTFCIEKLQKERKKKNVIHVYLCFLEGKNIFYQSILLLLCLLKSFGSLQRTAWSTATYVHSSEGPVLKQHSHLCVKCGKNMQWRAEGISG